MEHLNLGYVQGYTQALIDLREHMPILVDDMKRERIPVTKKRIEQILDVYIKHRADIRYRKGFVRWNRQRKEFEFFTGG